MKISKTLWTVLFGASLALAMPPKIASASPTNGTGVANWTVVHSTGTLLVHVEINSGVASGVTLTGTQPALSALPILAYNSDGEPLRIRNVNNQRVYSGTYEITINPSNTSCTHCICSWFDSLCIFQGGSFNNCSVDGDTCHQWGCGGGGIDTLDLDFTTDPVPPI